MQENNIQTPQPTENKSNKNNLLVIVGIVVALVAVILVIVLVVKPGEGTPGGGGTVNPEEQKITINGNIINEDKVLVKLESSKVDTYDVVFELTIYDENKEIIRVFEETAHAVSSKKTTYHIVDTSGVLKDNYTYEIKTKEELKKDSSKIFNSKISHEDKKLENSIEIKIKNDANQVIDSVQVSAVYFNAKEVVGYTTQFISEFPATSSIIETVYVPTDESGELIKFDKYEIIINAYNHEK